MNSQHMKTARKQMVRSLYVKRTTYREVYHRWSVVPPVSVLAQLYIACHRDGTVNWDKASLYESEELIERNNVIIIKPNTDGNKTQSPAESLEDKKEESSSKAGSRDSIVQARGIHPIAKTFSRSPEGC